MSITKVTDAGLDKSRIVTPIITNGDMSVAQRGTSFTGQTSGAYYLDRFKTDITSLGTWTITQSTDVPTGQGFAKSMKFDCTTADASPSAGDFLILNQPIEGFNTASFKFGSSSAESLTLSFWVKSNKTGTYIVRFYDIDNQRVQSQSYTISSASTWEKKVIAISGDTVSGPNFDNGYAFAVNWCLGSGTTYTSGTLNTSWNSVTNANQFVGQVNLADSTDNEWYITGVQLEIGEFDSNTIPSFPFESFENNLKKCMRYYFNHYTPDDNGLYGLFTAHTSSAGRMPYRFIVPMRDAPTVSSSTASGFTWLGNNTSGNPSAIGSESLNKYSCTVNITGSFTQGYSYWLSGSTSTQLNFDAEL